jgi:hypothetical protein
MQGIIKEAVFIWFYTSEEPFNDILQLYRIKPQVDDWAWVGEFMGKVILFRAIS